MLNLQRHVAKLNAVWDMPDLSLADGGAKRIVGYLVNDWQLSGIFTGNSGNRYDLGYSFQSNGANRNLTGSPDYGARIVYVGDPGAGCTGEQYGQFNVASVTAPTTGSVGLESSRNLLIGCPNKTVDLSLARTIRLGGSRQLQFRVDAFNAFNTVIYNARSTTVQYETPTNLTIRNPQYLANGQLNPDRLTPRNAGFGAATGADNLRNFQAMIRFQF
jgi:hypothetical protein